MVADLAGKQFSVGQPATDSSARKTAEQQQWTALLQRGLRLVPVRETVVPVPKAVNLFRRNRVHGSLQITVGMFSLNPWNGGNPCCC